ncbi:hypothetical protein KDX04_33460 [Burkholderia cenocepacia]|uniref:hypothetical protein n=1 Tax=Burkholderia cenocepacia TaxID=95486 RepID=UPI001B98CF8C|nr:hypothetical protein [Burkholderia cenocepacia]MBR7990751.1 hypothetical protein [Burkholderia cenocepacia]
MVQRRNEPFLSAEKTCQWINLPEALWHFATYGGRTQSQEHIKPLHWYVACRLVIEGGFDPDEITPRPPFKVVRRKGKNSLVYSPELANGGERTILGGLKTKNVDVVVTKEGIGPVLAVSCKGMTGAFRNLTNRMEETIGECTNLHITYPALVFGFLFVIRANRQPEEVIESISGLVAESSSPTRQLAANDIALQSNNEPVESIFRFHSALRELTGRRGIRDDVSRYEAVSLALTESGGEHAGEAMMSFPPEGSPLRFEEFFQTLYLRYEERFLIGAPDLKSVTRRIEWDPESPALSQFEIDSNSLPTLDFSPRVQDD